MPRRNSPSQFGRHETKGVGLPPFCSPPVQDYLERPTITYSPRKPELSSSPSFQKLQNWESRFGVVDSFWLTTEQNDTMAYCRLVC